MSGIPTPGFSRLEFLDGAQEESRRKLSLVPVSIPERRTSNKAYGHQYVQLYWRVSWRIHRLLTQLQLRHLHTWQRLAKSHAVVKGIYMLETLDTSAPYMGIKPEVWDYQQATLMTSALYLGEGHFILNQSKNGRGGLQYHVEVGFTNQDPALIDFVCGWLEQSKIPHFICPCTNAYQIKVQRYEPVKRIIDLMEPYLMGKKLHEARIVRRFVERRLARGNAKIGDNNFRKYTNEDANLILERKSLRESSETIRFPVCWNKHRHLTEDIVH